MITKAAAGGKKIIGQMAGEKAALERSISNSLVLTNASYIGRKRIKAVGLSE
jgi:hypothetical protein